MLEKFTLNLSTYNRFHQSLSGLVSFIESLSSTLQVLNLQLRSLLDDPQEAHLQESIAQQDLNMIWASVDDALRHCSQLKRVVVVTTEVPYRKPWNVPEERTKEILKSKLPRMQERGLLRWTVE